MAKGKAKWLEEANNKELIVIVQSALNSGDEKEVKKALKAIVELDERTPDTDGQITVEEALESLEMAVGTVKAAYQAEIDAVEDEDVVDADFEEVDEDEAEEEDENDLESLSKKELAAMAKDLGIKGAKKKDKDELIALIKEAQGEEEDEEEEEEDETPDYSEMTKKDLIALAKERGIKVNKKMKPAEIIELLEADDEE
ncbi:chaperone protein [Clostridium phage CP3]|nr:chaperone protein [Clostridium phage CP3]